MLHYMLIVGINTNSLNFPIDMYQIHPVFKLVQVFKENITIIQM